jgi:hypothetical protein
VGALREKAMGHDVSIKSRNMESIGKRGTKSVDLMGGFSNNKE